MLKVKWSAHRDATFQKRLLLIHYCSINHSETMQLPCATTPMRNNSHVQLLPDVLHLCQGHTDIYAQWIWFVSCNSMR